MEAVNCEPASGRFVSSRGQRVTVCRQALSLLRLVVATAGNIDYAAKPATGTHNREQLVKGSGVLSWNVRMEVFSLATRKS